MQNTPSTKLFHEWRSPAGKKLALEIFPDKIIFYSKFNSQSNEFETHQVIDSNGYEIGGIPMTELKVNLLKAYIKQSKISMEELPDFVKKIVGNIRVSKNELQIS
jgi:hypothetical protein